MNLDELIKEIKETIDSRDLCDETLKERGCSTREEIGIGEYSYGITMVPACWILPYLEQLQEMQK